MHQSASPITRQQYACDRCGGSGKTPHLHIANGICFKCIGRGTLPYDPQLQDGVEGEAFVPDYDAYIQKKEREFWENFDGEQDAADAQRFWEENGFEAVLS